MSAVPVCTTIVSLTTPPGCPPTPCVETGAGVGTNTPKTLANGVLEDVEFNFVNFEDPPSSADLPNEGVLAGVTGNYNGFFFMNFGAADPGPGVTATTFIYVNGVSVQSFLTPATGSQSSAFSLELTAGDLVQFFVMQNGALEGVSLDSASFSITHPCPTAVSLLCPATGAVITIPESTQGIDPSFTGEQIIFDTDSFELLPTDANAANNRIVIGASGYYFISADITYDANGAIGQAVTTCVFVDGVSQSCMTTASDGTNPMSQHLGVLLFLNAGAVVTLNGQTVGEAPMPVVSAALSAMRLTCGSTLAPGG